MLVTLLAGAAGALLQWSASGGFAEIAPGRMATLPVAILLGPWYGIAATVLSALSGTLRPLLVVLRIVEALVVGVAARRGHSPLLVGGLCLIALALVLGFAPELYGIPSVGPNDWARAMQMLLNRMVPLVVASLIAATASHGLWQDSGSSPRRLRTYAFHAFVLVAVLPVVILSATTGQMLAAQQESEGTSQLNAIATARRDRIQEFVDSHVAVVETLAFGLSQEKRPAPAADAARKLSPFSSDLRPHHPRRSAGHGASTARGRCHRTQNCSHGASATASTSRQPRRRSARPSRM